MKSIGCVLALVAASASGADVVYENLQQPVGSWAWWRLTEALWGETASAAEAPGGSENDARIGQLIEFAGTARRVTAIETRLSFSHTPPEATVALTLTIRANDGGIPGAVLWSGDRLVQAVSGFQQYTVATFTPHLVLPDAVFIDFGIDNIVGQASTSQIGMLLSRATPSIGGASEQVIVQDSTTQQWTWTSLPPNAFFLQARITAEIEGACYANCDGSTAAPVLNVADFTCFLQRFAAGDGYANCDGSTAVPLLNVADFTCFLQRFAAGCP